MPPPLTGPLGSARSPRGVHAITQEDLNLIILALRQKAANDRKVAGRLREQCTPQHMEYIEQAHHAITLAKQIVGA